MLVFKADLLFLSY